MKEPFRKVLVTEPIQGNTFEEQLISCLSNFKQILQKRDLSFLNIITQTVFIKAAENTDFYNKKRLFYNAAKPVFQNNLPTTSIVGQEPSNDKQIAIEAIVVDDNNASFQIEYKQCGHSTYTLVSADNTKEVYASCISRNDNKNLQDGVRSAFQIMKDILQQENLNFSNVVRQWSYLENITLKKEIKGVSKQNYQIFNDIRAEYYGESEFLNGYPAATGIGMNTGGCVIEFIAASHTKDFSIIPIRNPLQINAFDYSQEVLVGMPDNENPERCTPKFERAKFYKGFCNQHILISGTAAIQGELTLAENNVAEQTEITMQNILEIISNKNLHNHELQIAKKAQLTNMRVYVKFKKDITTVKEVCERYFSGNQVLYLVADMCRDNLLVEIEGTVLLS